MGGWMGLRHFLSWVLITIYNMLTPVSAMRFLNFTPFLEFYEKKKSAT